MNDAPSWALLLLADHSGKLALLGALGRLLSRARWVVASGILSRCEKLLRVHARWLAIDSEPDSFECSAVGASWWHTEDYDFVGIFCTFASTTAMTLRHDKVLGPTALRICLSLFAAERKLLVFWLAAVAKAEYIDVATDGGFEAASSSTTAMDFATTMINPFARIDHGILMIPGLTAYLLQSV